jgi:hypothetical protein
MVSKKDGIPEIRRKTVTEKRNLLGQYGRRLLRYLQTSQTSGLVLLSVVVGAAAGLGP